MEIAEREFFANMIRKYLNPIVKQVITEAAAEALADIIQKNRKHYYTRKEACERLRIGTTTFYRLVKKGKIKLLKVEGKTLVDADEFDTAVTTGEVWRYKHY